MRGDIVQPGARDGALFQKPLPHGMEAVVYPRMYNSILTYGPANDPYGYTTHWCYETPGQAIMAAEEWDGTGEPEGWFRHAASGRRRPNGDPDKEYVDP